MICLGILQRSVAAHRARVGKISRRRCIELTVSWDQQGSFLWSTRYVRPMYQVTELMLCSDSPASATTCSKGDGRCTQEETGSKSQVARATRSYILTYFSDL